MARQKKAPALPKMTKEELVAKWGMKAIEELVDHSFGTPEDVEDETYNRFDGFAEDYANYNGDLVEVFGIKMSKVDAEKIRDNVEGSCLTERVKKAIEAEVNKVL